MTPRTVYTECNNPNRALSVLEPFYDLRLLVPVEALRCSASPPIAAVPFLYRNGCMDAKGLTL